MPFDITIKQSQFRDGCRYVYERWIPAEPKGLLVFVHDVGGNASVAQSFVETFVHQGYAVCLYDQRGHGKSGGRHHHVDRFTSWVDDLDEFVQHCREATGGNIPLFVVGEGIGALIALSFVMSRPLEVTGVVSLGGCFEPAKRLTPWQERLMGRLLPILPTARLYGFDERISLNAYREVERVIELMMPQGLRLRTPILLMHGSDDDVAALQGSKNFAAGLMMAEKKMIVYTGEGHALLQGDRSGEVLTTMAGWFEERLQAKSHAVVRPAHVQQESLWG